MYDQGTIPFENIYHIVNKKKISFIGTMLKILCSSYEYMYINFSTIKIQLILMSS